MPEGRSKRIVLVTNEVLGLMRNGGAGTANTFLSFALAGLGHQVEVLFTAPAGPADLDPVWSEQYSERGIEVQTLARPAEHVVPEKLATTCAVHDVLKRRPPDIVIAHDWDGPAYASLRSRQLGLGLSETTFVVYCHGTNGWVYDAHRKVRRSPASFELQALEQASVELADIVVSPSAYLIEWMRSCGWRVPRSCVIPYFSRSAVDGGAFARSTPGGDVRRLAFFGRLEERKGIKPFLEALNGLETGRLAGIELVFVGRETPLWPVERIQRDLSVDVKKDLAALRFETDLDQPEAIALLKEPGTLAVMPSLVDNSPNVIYECLEHGIPFLASNAGGGPELVAAEDRARAFVEPTAEGIQVGLDRLLSTSDGLSVVRPGFDPDQVLAAWQRVIASTPSSHEPLPESARQRVSVLLTHRGGPRQLQQSLAAVEKQTRPPEQVVVVETANGTGGADKPESAGHLTFVTAPSTDPSALREAGLGATTGDLVLLLDDGDELDPDCLETLLRAQVASGADVVTCGTRRKLGRVEEVRLFLGEPGALGLLGNYYGSVALYSRPLLETANRVPDTQGDTDWVLLATLSRGGGHIVSVPRPLAYRQPEPGGAATDPIGSGAALAVVRAFQQACPPEIREMPRLVASLAARRAVSDKAASVAERIRWIWHHEGATGLARRSTTRATRLIRQRG